MPEEPMTQTLNITTTRAQLTSLVKQVFLGERRIIIEKSGIPVAALISAADAERFAAYERQREEDFSELAQLQKTFDDVPAREHEREVDRAVAAARRRMENREQAPANSSG